MKILTLSTQEMSHKSAVLNRLPDVEIEVLSTKGCPFPDTPHNRLLAAQHHVALAQAHPLSGVDAIFLDTFGDYGCDAIRSLTGLPVFGAGESALTVARARAPRFAIITVWPASMRFIYSERLRTCRAEDSCTGIIHVPDTPNNSVPLVEKVSSAAQESIHNLNAEAIVLGCTCMAGMFEQLSLALPVPVICPARTGMAFTIAAAACDWRTSTQFQQASDLKKAACTSSSAPGGR